MVVRPVVDAEVAGAFGGQAPYLWDWRYQLDEVIGEGGRRYCYDIWVGDDPRAGANPLATAAAHPLLAAFGILVRGPALLVPRGGADYTLEDWTRIRRGTHDDVGLVGQNVGGPSALQTRGRRPDAADDPKLNPPGRA